MLFIRIIWSIWLGIIIVNLEQKIVTAHELHHSIVQSSHKPILNETIKIKLTIPELLYFHDQNIWVIGDSLMVGWDGHKVVHDSCPKIVEQLLQPKNVNDNYSYSGAQISGNRNVMPIDLTNNVTNIINDSSFKKADYLLIALGVNDLNYSDNNLGYVQQRLQSNIIRLKNVHPSLKIIGAVPFASYLKNKKSDYSLQELQQALQSVFYSFGIPVLNWQQTDFYYNRLSLGDNVHPKASTYRQMSYTIADFMIANRNISISDWEQNKKLFLSNGWQTDELGNKQYAINNTLLSDWHFIDDKLYYFDPLTKSLKKE